MSGTDSSQWVPPGYVACTDLECEGHLMTMGRPHAHLLADRRWLIEQDRTGLVQPGDHVAGRGPTQP